MDNKDIEKIMNQIYPGLTHYVRDVDLDKKYINNYKVGNIIYEKAFVDTTCKIGKLNKTTRYSIFSNQAVELNTIADKKYQNNWGLCLIDRNSAFKILDIYEYNNKTLITLLHIPLELSELLRNVSTNLDDQIINTARSRFEKSFNDKTFIELDDEWYTRLKFPLGMSDEGILFNKPE